MVDFRDLVKVKSWPIANQDERGHEDGALVSEVNDLAGDEFRLHKVKTVMPAALYNDEPLEPHYGNHYHTQELTEVLAVRGAWEFYLLDTKTQRVASATVEDRLILMQPDIAHLMIPIGDVAYMLIFANNDYVSEKNVAKFGKPINTYVRKLDPKIFPPLTELS
jgi:hypothetical protein